jgi:type I restriction enzyme S subunit
MSKSRVAERSAAYALQAAVEPAFGASFDLLATAPQGVAKLRELILLLAMQGRLVKQDPRDEPVDLLLNRIRAKKERLISEGEIKRDKPLADIAKEEAPYKLPQSWQWARMSDVASYIQRGKGPIYAAKSKFRVISQKCVRWHGLDIGPARCITQESLANYESIRFLQPGDLLWNSTGTGTIGRACLFPVEYDGVQLVADSHVTVVRPLEVDAGFLRRWIQSPYVQSQIEEMASGTTNQIELNTSTVISHLLPLPPLAEQARIVASVEELMQLCNALEVHGRLQDEQHARLVATLFDALAASASAEELAENWQRIAAHFDLLLDRPEAVDALEQTLLQLAVRGLIVAGSDEDTDAKDSLAPEFEREHSSVPDLDSVRIEEPPFDLPRTWQWVRFGSVLDFKGGSQPPKSTFSEVPLPGYVRLVQIRDLGDKPQPVYVKRSSVSKFCNKDDVMVGRYGASVGKVFWGIEGAYNVALIKMIDEHDLFDRNYLHLLLSSSVGQSWFKGISRSAQDGFNKNDLSPQLVPLPPLAEQHRIVARVEQLRRLCAELRERLQQARATQSRLADALVSAAAQSPSC